MLNSEFSLFKVFVLQITKSISYSELTTLYTIRKVGNDLDIHLMYWRI